jgi:hypothetical protein
MTPKRRFEANAGDSSSKDAAWEKLLDLIAQLMARRWVETWRSHAKTSACAQRARKVDNPKKRH